MLTPIATTAGQKQRPRDDELNDRLHRAGRQFRWEDCLRSSRNGGHITWADPQVLDTQLNAASGRNREIATRPACHPLFG